MGVWTDTSSMQGNLAISIKIREKHTLLQPPHSEGFILQLHLRVWEMAVASLLTAELFDKSKDGEQSERLLLEEDYMNYEAGP